MERSVVAAALWPEERDASARANLRRHMHMLGSALDEFEPNLIDGQRNSLAWKAGSHVLVDTSTFDELSHDRDSWPAAVELYRGDFLRGIDDEWAIGVREAYRARAVEMLLELGDDALRNGNFEAAMTFADRLLAEDDLREEAIRLKMSAAYKGGDRLGALAVYDRFAEHLRCEMNVDPMVDTIALHTAITAGAPLPISAALTPMTPNDARGPLLPLIGRRAEFDRLRGQWIRATHGQGSTTFLEGEAGIGKSRLAHELAMVAAQQGGIVLRGATSSTHASPFETMVAALRSGLPYLAQARVEDIWLSALSELVPEVNELRPQLLKPEPLDAASAQARLFEAFARCFSAISRLKPLLVVLEDVQWASGESLAPLQAIARRCSAIPLQLIVTIRTSEPLPAPLETVRSALVRERRASVLTLGPLNSDVDDPVLSEAITMSGGNPLFVTLLMHAHRETGALPTDAYEVSSVSDAIKMRMASLQEHSRAIAEAAAVIGSPFAASMLTQVGGWDIGAVYSALDALLDAGIIREESPAFDYVFSHALIERAIYHDLDNETRIRRHRRVAAMLDKAKAPAEAARVARHWLLSGERDHARVGLLRAAEHSLSGYTWSEALDHASTALALCVADQDRIAPLRIIANASARLGDMSKWNDAITELETITTRLQSETIDMEVALERIAHSRYLADRKRQKSTIDWLLSTAEQRGNAYFKQTGLLALGKYYYETGDAEQSAAVLNDLMRGDFSRLRHGEAIEAYVELGKASKRLGRSEEAYAHAEKARALAVDAPLSALRAVLELDAEIAGGQGRLSMMESCARQELDIDRRTGDALHEARALVQLGVGAQSRLADAREAFESALVMARTSGNRHTELMAVMNRASVEARYGRFDLTLEYATVGLALGREIKHSAVTGHALFNQALAHAGLGDFDLGLSLAHDALNGSVDQFTRAGACARIAEIHLAKNEVDVALDWISQAIEARRESQNIGSLIDDLTLLASAHAAARHESQAADAAREIIALTHDNLQDRLRPVFICTTLANVCDLSGETLEADRWIERGRAIFTQRLAHVPDEPTKESYRNLPYNRQLLVAR